MLLGVGPSHPLPRTCLGQSAMAGQGGVLLGVQRAPMFDLALGHPLPHLHSRQPTGHAVITDRSHPQADRLVQERPAAELLGEPHFVNLRALLSP